MMTLNALSAADSVIIPVQAHYLPAKCMTQLMRTITKVKKHRLHFRSVKTEYSSQRLLIDKATFYEWLENQTHYKIVEGKENLW